jgi:TRAP-type C4-dicarboxylate transport system permease small subunit
MTQYGVLSFYEKLKKFNTFCASLASLILVFVTFSIFYDVFMRYLFNRPSVWITEVSTYLLLYMTFLGTSYALQQGAHIRVTFLSDLFNLRAQRIITLITSSVALAFCLVLLWQTGKMTWLSMARHWTSPTMLSIPLIYVYSGMVFGSFMLLLTFVIQILLTFRGNPENEAHERKEEKR